jgi:predicted acyl esterase
VATPSLIDLARAIPELPPLPEVEPGSYVVERDVMVPMRDGVRLANDIYYPARGGVRLSGRFPTILERTPYNKEAEFHGRSPLNAPYLGQWPHARHRQRPERQMARGPRSSRSGVDDWTSPSAANSGKWSTCDDGRGKSRPR